jgi:hypothetical protein
MGFDEFPVEAAILSYFMDNGTRSRIQPFHDAPHGFFPVLPVMK